MARILYGDRDEPSVVTQAEPPFRFEKNGEQYNVRLRLPFAAKGEVVLFKKGDELVVTIRPSGESGTDCRNEGE
jgi:arsenite-transporting ATPase